MQMEMETKSRGTGRLLAKLLLFGAGAASLLAAGLLVGLVAGLTFGSPLSAGGAGGLIEETVQGTGRDKIAAIWVEGILTHSSAGGLSGSREGMVARVCQQLDRAAADAAVKGVVLVIDSPGGTVTASDILHERVQRFRKAGKKVVVCVRDMAASGGYYVAAAADRVICHPTGLTGSIGVIWPHFDLSRLIDSKLLITYSPIKSAEKKDMGSPARPLTKEESDILQAVVKDAHARFVDVVRQGRNIPEQEVRKLADGSIYTASQSKENGLVDAIGYFDEAVAAACQLCAVTEATIVKYRKRPGLFDLIFGGYASGERVGSVLESFVTGVPMYLWSPGLPPSIAHELPSLLWQGP